MHSIFYVVNIMIYEFLLNNLKIMTVLSGSHCNILAPHSWKTSMQKANSDVNALDKCMFINLKKKKSLSPATRCKFN